MLATALFLAQQASAQSSGSVTATTIELWRQELTGPIEAAAGRRFVERPKILIMSADRVLDRKRRVSALDARWVASLRAAGERAYVIGEYYTGTQEILLTPEQWRALFVTRRLDEALLEPVAKCTVAHELVHALQHQYVPIHDDPVRSAVREGFADHVAAKVCGDGASWSDLVQGLDVPASRAPAEHLAFEYGFGETFVRVLEEVAGIEAVWSAMDDGPVTRELIERVGAVGLPAGWSDANRLAPVGGMLGAEASWTVRAGPMSPTAALAPLRGTVEDTLYEIPAVGGLQWTASLGDHHVRALAFLLREPGDARRWLADRRAGVGRSGNLWMLFDAGSFYEGFRTRAVPPLAKLPGVDDTFALHVDLAGDWAYLEQWVVRGRYLLGAALSDARPDAKRVTAAVAALAALDLPDLPVDAAPTEADLAALRALAPAAPPAPGVHWSYRHAQQIPVMLRGEWSRCAQDLEEALPAYTGQGRDQLAALGTFCAVTGADLPAAERHVAALGGLPRTPPRLREGLAALLADAGRWKEALAALPATRTAASADVELRAAVGLARWADAERLLRAGGATLDARIGAARALATAGRADAARSALAASCPTQPEDDRARCVATAADLGR